MMGMGRLSNFGNSDTGRLSNFNIADMYSVQSSRGPTPRPSNFEENSAPGALNSSPRFGYFPPQPGPTSYPAPNLNCFGTNQGALIQVQRKSAVQQSGDLGGEDFSFGGAGRDHAEEDKEKEGATVLSKLGPGPTAELDPKAAGLDDAGARKHMPPAASS
ncbi:UNVERIFIED_CONTAM: Auxin efflux carrier component 3 [Sesamum calycinum]|uniref:Auxin efflux carrier component 3 n=1 Tax=Sesamum calycinum TaxID=2727403 RepID=A0AAW2SX63_9LAMI